MIVHIIIAVFGPCAFELIAVTQAIYKRAFRTWRTEQRTEILYVAVNTCIFFYFFACPI